MTYWFDMDGTIANLYGVENWLEYLLKEDTMPYETAMPLVNMAHLAKALNKAQKNGKEIGIISWTCKNGTAHYNKAVAKAKVKWLKTHLPSVEWNEIKIVEYGTPKQTLAKSGDILFDDEKPNRVNWGKNAYEPKDIFEVLKLG